MSPYEEFARFLASERAASEAVRQIKEDRGTPTRSLPGLCLHIERAANGFVIQGHRTADAPAETLVFGDSETMVAFLRAWADDQEAKAKRVDRVA